MCCCAIRTALLAGIAMLLLGVGQAEAAQLTVPHDARQLIVVSSPTTTPANYLATLRLYQRTSSGAPWRPAGGPWQAETGSGHLLVHRREGDHATPIGVFGIGLTMYGVDPRPSGLHYAYHQLICGDWWDEDSFTAQYNQFVHVPCGVTPAFAHSSEALWTERTAYTHFAVIDFNMRPTVAGADAPGSGIFLHSWMNAPTEGCVALKPATLLTVLRWLRPSAHPVIEIGTNAQISVP
jgi:L,D-peptidoglycan transpeptidase YkuD (ErfK/YbiS/YcfS/YnhG family)